jgi:hypothetical protein
MSQPRVDICERARNGPHRCLTRPRSWFAPPCACAPTDKSPSFRTGVKVILASFARDGRMDANHLLHDRVMAPYREDLVKG